MRLLKSFLCTHLASVCLVWFSFGLGLTGRKVYGVKLNALNSISTSVKCL